MRLCLFSFAISTLLQVTFAFCGFYCNKNKSYIQTNHIVIPQTIKEKRKKMKFLNKTTAIAAILMLTIAIPLVAIPLANAQHNPGWNITTFAYINVAPNPVGVGQKVDILIWVDKPRAQARILNDYRMHKYRLTILDSANNVVKSEFWETVIDTTSSQYYAWTPDTAGTYTLNFNFEGFYA